MGEKDILVLRTLLVIAAFLSTWAMPVRSLRAAPTQNDVFKSIHDSVGEQSDFDPKPMILLALGGGVLMLVFVAFNHRQQRTTTTKPVNNPNRLVKEVLRDVPLRPAEMKQLRLLAESVQSQVGETPNPLTMVLCPSLLAKGLQSNPAKIDRKAVAQVVRKMKLPGLPKS